MVNVSPPPRRRAPVAPPAAAPVEEPVQRVYAARQTSARQLVIDKGQHIPDNPHPAPRNVWEPRPYPFSDMEPGDSFAVYPQPEQSLLTALYLAAGAALVHSPERTYEIRYQAGTHIRVWRTA